MQPNALDTLPANLRSGLELKQLPALDGLRAIAAFLVVFYHFGSPAIPGGLGVLAFFVLSGFLITWLLLEEHERHGSVSLKHFYIRRTLRIFPAFYVYWLLIVARTAYTGKIVWPQAISSFFYLTNYYQALYGDPNTGLSHTWSLAVEEQFYLLWPLAFLFLLRLPQPTAIRVLIATIGVFWLYRAFLRFIIHVNQGYLYEAFDARADHLLAGCLLAFVLRQGAFPRLWQILTSSVIWSLLTVAGLVLSSFLALRGGTGYRDTTGFIVEPLLVALLIPQLMAFRHSPLWRWMSWPAVKYLGSISYSVYLYQQLTPGLIEKLLARQPHGLQVAANFVAVILAASVSFYAIERPFVKLKDRFRLPAPQAPKLDPPLHA